MPALAIIGLIAWLGPGGYVTAAMIIQALITDIMLAKAIDDLSKIDKKRDFTPPSF